MATASSNNRASLLAGLRTGGVRSSSSTIPHTAAPSQATFNVPRFPSHSLNSNAAVFPDDFDDDEVVEIPQSFRAAQRGVPVTAAVDGNRGFAQQQRGMPANGIPFSPAFSNNFIPQQQQQQQQQNLQAQAIQLQMQLEMMRLQAQAAQVQQNYQAELLAQSQRQQQQAPSARRASFNPPATAGPLSNGFDLRTATLSAQLRRANQANLSAAGPDEVPMTAALGGKFGSRSTSSPMSRLNSTPSEDYSSVPPTPHSTTVISGGTSLGSLSSNNMNSPVGSPQSKSDSVSSWRRGVSKGNSALRSVTSPSVKVTPPPPERVSPPPALSSANSESVTPTLTTPPAKARPQPLKFSAAVSQPLPAVTIDRIEIDGSSSDDSIVLIAGESETDNDDGYSSSSSSNKSKSSSPTTPSSNEMTTMMMTMAPPLSPREEATKKLYEGLGIGRPRSALTDAPNSVPSTTDNSPTKTTTFATTGNTILTTTLNPHSPPFNPGAAPFTPSYNIVSNNSAPVINNTTSVPLQTQSATVSTAGVAPSASLPSNLQAFHRLVSQPMRQPRGPPSGTDELGPKNFATRIRRKAIGGLGMLVDARERRELIGVY